MVDLLPCSMKQLRVRRATFAGESAVRLVFGHKRDAQAASRRRKELLSPAISWRGIDGNV